MSLPKRVRIVEVGPRDGLQNEKEVVSADDKVRFINLLTESGLSVIEPTSFVSPKWVPQLADAAQVYANIQKKRGVLYPVLVPNRKGLERAVASGVKEIAVFTAASDDFNRSNLGQTVQESLDEIRGVVSLAKKEKLWIRGYVSTVFACPYAGRITPEQVLPVVEALLSLGVHEVSLGDTIGAAVPTDVEALLEKLLRHLPAKKLAVHFHDTKGRAVDNVLKALNMGIVTVDSSAGGLGGCPFAPGAPGNVSTEKILQCLHDLGIETGVDPAKVAAASGFVRKKLNPSYNRPGKS